MGDISTHGEIADHIIAILREEWREENYAFFELGNWLTDTSQFKDPYAMIAGKVRIWSEARAALDQSGQCVDPVVHWISLPLKTCLQSDQLRFDDFANSMMGRPGTDGALTGFLRDLMFVAGCEKFRHSPYSIPPAEFDEIFQTHFTQYYPHEHLDFPPWPHGNPNGDRSLSGRHTHGCAEAPAPGNNSASSRQILNYLEDQIEYVSETLTWIENTWRRVSSEHDSADNRRTKREVLALFGHASHAVEDFYFHSNFVELAWAGLSPPRPVPTSGGSRHHRERRIYFRRLRSPVFTNNRLSQSNSEPAQTVFTGSFGADDVYHTFMDALEGLAEYRIMRGADERATVRNPRARTFQFFLNRLGTADGRRSMRELNGPERTEFLQEWRRYADGQARTDAGFLLVTHTWDQRSHDAFVRAMALDRAMFDRFNAPSFPQNMRGPFAFLTHILCAAQQAHDASEARSIALDAASREAEVASDDGSSMENIGCHSLMAKDSPRKQPLRQSATNLATWVACYVARIMARQLNSSAVCAARLHHGADPNLGTTLDRSGPVDWLHLLQHFLCHPEECEEQWHEGPLLADGAVDARNRTLPSLTSHVLRFLEPSEVSARLARRMKQNLERRYRDLETQAERDWANRP